jgi:hypothetical protein
MLSIIPNFGGCKIKNTDVATAADISIINNQLSNINTYSCNQTYKSQTFAGKLDSSKISDMTLDGNFKTLKVMTPLWDRRFYKARQFQDR